MKYWVYKNSRILGPYDADSMAGVPGLDEATLVGVGDSATDSAWRPAGDIAELEGLALSQRAWGSAVADDPTSYALLDNLQIETAGLIDDNDFPTIARSLFEDVGPTRKPLGSLMRASHAADPLELARVQDRVSDLSQQLERLYQKVVEIQSSQVNFVSRLTQGETILPPTSATPASVSPAPQVAVVVQPDPFAFAPIDQAAAAMSSTQVVAPTPQAPVPPLMPAEIVSAPTRSQASPPIKLIQVPIPPVPPAGGTTPPPFEWVQDPLPAIGNAAPFATTEPRESAPPAPQRSWKSAFVKGYLKVVVPVQGLRLAEQQTNLNEEKLKAIAPVISPPPAVEPIVAPPLAEVTPPGRIIPGLFEAPAASVAPVPEPQPAPTTALPTFTSSPVPAPPATLNFGEKPPPVFGKPESIEPELPSSWANFGATTVDTAIPAAPNVPTTLNAPGATVRPAPAVPARLAKPAAPPPTDDRPKTRTSWTFLLGISAVVLVLAGVFMVFLRHPKDFKPMTELDDGRSRIGTEPGSEGLSASATPSNPTPTTPEQIPTLTPAPAQMQEPIESTHAAAQANSDAAITLVKEYPLDGSRGSVGQWLQYSYTATPDAGSEDWSASETSDKTYLVEYRFTPSARGAAGVHYLFEADMEHGFVIGKNLDAKNMLGGIDVKQAPKKARPAAAKHKSPAARRITSPRASQRTRRNDHPGRVPLLPLPSESELRPPSQDEGGFMPDTVNSDI